MKMLWGKRRGCGTFGTVQQTMRIFSSAEYCRRVARRISLTVFSALPLHGRFSSLNRLDLGAFHGSAHGMRSGELSASSNI
jgi:hypothetical protein